MAVGPVEKGINVLVHTLTGGHKEIVTNPKFLEHWKKIEKEPRDLSTIILDSGTLLIIEGSELIPRFIIKNTG